MANSEPDGEIHALSPGFRFAQAGLQKKKVSRATADFMRIEANEALSLGVHADPHDEIVRLEARLDELAESLARCRKVRLASQIAVAGGAVWLLAMLVRLAGFDPAAMMMAMAGVIGGIVMYGSNATTAEQFDVEMKEAEARRTALIGALDLRVVGNGPFPKKSRRNPG